LQNIQNVIFFSAVFNDYIKEHVARMGEGRNVYRVLGESPKEKGHLKDQGVDRRMGSKWSLGKLVEEV
jgi:hypothetical protein